MNSNEFWTLYAQQDAIRDEAQRVINNAKTSHYATLEHQPGDRGRLRWRDNSNNEDVAVTGLYINYTQRTVRPSFVLVNQDGTASKQEYKPQGGWTFELVERGAFPQFMQEGEADQPETSDDQPADTTQEGQFSGDNWVEE
jgi:hypothetical protein